MTACCDSVTLPEYSKCRILIGADAAQSGVAWGESLKSLGYQNVTQVDGLHHDVLLAQGVFDLVLWDAQAGELEFVLQIRRQFSLAVLPVVVIYGVDRVNVRNAALQAGANDCLAAPVDLQELGLRVHNLLVLRMAHKAHFSAQNKLDMLIENGLLMAMTRDHSELIQHTLFEGRRLLQCDAASMYLVTESKTLRFVMRTREDALESTEVALYESETGLPNEHYVSTCCALQRRTILIDDVYQETRFDLSGTRRFDAHSGYRTVSMLTAPIAMRGCEVRGVIQFINRFDPGTREVVPFTEDMIPLVEALAAQAAVSFENLALMDARKAFVESLIHTIATAIDAKSPHTGRHSARVPELALMLAEAAHNTTHGPLADFKFHTDDEWHEFRVGAWLHDCGKITTPEFVINKASKLETIYNRIHEVRTRFEVLLRDADIERLQVHCSGGDGAQADAKFEARKAQLMEDFALIAKCNLGEERMSESLRERVAQIGKTTWLRYFDDQLGLAHEELARRTATPAQVLPALELLLSDQPHHRIKRESDTLPDPGFGFKVDVPQYLYNQGEIYNLNTIRGTLTVEDRYKINEHMIHGIMMLERMPFPKSLQRVPEYAGTHHETLLGTGYPRRLTAAELSVPARIMMVADIFEALTASDRPYKTSKKLSEALSVLHSLKSNGLIDADLFDLFLTSGVYMDYARKFLAPEQLDTIEIQAYLGPRGAPAPASPP